MLGEHHSLINEFPEYKDRIHELKMNNRHFGRLSEKYESIDKEIFRIEEQIENTTDEHLEELKFKRVQLKDELYALLKNEN
jgi:uncharacterized protein YdcH (DUF465 family)